MNISVADMIACIVQSFSNIPFHSICVRELKRSFLRYHCGSDSGCGLGSTSQTHAWSCELTTELTGGGGVWAVCAGIRFANVTVI